MGGISGFVARSEAGEALQARLLESAQARLGAPTYSCRHASLWGPTGIGRRSGVARIVAAGTVHNSNDIGRELGIPPPTSAVSLLGEAFAEWGRRACQKIHGDWCAAAWDPVTRELLVARDPYGNTSLYYHSSRDVFAFSTSQDDLKALDLTPAILNDLYLAQVLVTWPAYHGTRTINSAIKRLPPAHLAIVAGQKLELCNYWRLEDTSAIRLARRADYVERFKELFDQAVRQRLPSEGSVATTLSAGLDSGSVALTAAPRLAESGRRLAAYVSTPLSDPSAFIGRGIGNEFALAAETARMGHTIDLHPIVADHVSPIVAIREMLRILKAPEHAAGGMYWLLEVFRTAAQDGNRTVLTGQMGNCGASWAGDPTSLPIKWQMARYGLSHMAKLRLRRLMPWPVERAYRRMHRGDRFVSSPIRQDFADRLNLSEQMDDDRMAGFYLPIRDERMRSLRPGALANGFFYADLGAALGVRITDPTADPRLLEFCVAIPDQIFVDAETGMDRWLIREAMRGKLPESVRLNRRKGRQSGDLVCRLRSHATDVEQALAEIEHGPGAEFVDVPKMRAVWDRIRTEDSPEALALAITHTTRGIMAGLFVNGFGTLY